MITNVIWVNKKPYNIQRVISIIKRKDHYRMASNSSSSSTDKEDVKVNGVAFMSALGKLIVVCTDIMKHYIQGGYVEGAELKSAEALAFHLSRYKKAYDRSRDTPACHTKLFEPVLRPLISRVIKEGIDSDEWIKKGNIEVQFASMANIRIAVSTIYSIASDISKIRKAELEGATEEEKSKAPELVWTDFIKLNLYRMLKALSRNESEMTSMSTCVVELEVNLDIGTPPDNTSGGAGSIDLSGMTNLINQVAPGMVPENLDTTQLFSPEGPIGGVVNNVMTMMNDPNSMEQIKKAFGGMMNNFVPQRPSTNNDSKPGVAPIEGGVSDIQVI